MKIVRLTEEKITELVKDTIYNLYGKLPLMEYAIERKKFVEDARHLAWQIVENLCLIHYRTLTEDETLKNHWKQEAYAHIENIMRDTLKGGNSYEGRKKAVIQGFEEAEVFDENSTPYLTSIKHKFKKEQINQDSPIVMECMKYVARVAMPTIVELIARIDYDGLDSFLDSI